VGDLRSNLENVRQRYALSPYLYSLVHRAYLYGEPVYPPLVYYYQADSQVRELGSEKMVGRDLLVAAVAKYGQPVRQVYLPAGTWVDYHTGEWYESEGGISGRSRSTPAARSVCRRSRAPGQLSRRCGWMTRR
jgi:alpha-glucosidase